MSENPGYWDVEKIRNRCHIGHWSTALSRCLELLVTGEIGGTKTSRGWLFWAPSEKLPWADCQMLPKMTKKAILEELERENET